MSATFLNEGTLRELFLLRELSLLRELVKKMMRTVVNLSLFSLSLVKKAPKSSLLRNVAGTIPQKVSF